MTDNIVIINPRSGQVEGIIDLRGLLSSILGSVQLQRGLGTSASGSGAFGASVNMSTALVSPSPHRKT